ncbi:hypothetical protein CC1G_02727 [Coprinopsis cinerea okayama7|uniref:F-box domain-containing protein n=1 Tax=Coprinopsis cinerea (strain Okayama-7 / 130 / ATCC MYA-4618 / FGSC 9003) TaxID=240176 RepID=A8PBT1_COPC7|nr:hypothetical protein CC1G_02727 [Coprinopsis cinerea okayama7\|eukprot:XP_001840264.2 hypothetical protein CC1G_02727 [Coprinopsis cinerea okayama7\
MTQILDLPSELLVLVFQNLDCSNLFKLCRVCRLTKELVQNDVKLQVITALGVNGIEDGKPEMEYFAKIDRLQDLRRRWRTLDWQATFNYIIESPMRYRAYELVDGIFAQLEPDGTLDLLQLPSSEDPTTTVLCHKKLEFTPSDFAFDPSQDIIAFLTMAAPGSPNPRRRSLKVSVHHLSNLKAEPLISLPFDIAVAEPAWLSFISPAIQVAGYAVGVFIDTGPGCPARLVIWNWKTGALVADSDRDQNLPNLAFSWSFVDEQHYHITSTRNGGFLEVYRFDPTGTFPGSTHVTSFLLPPLLQSVLLESFHSRCEPWMASPSARSFRSSPEKQMHVFKLQYLELATFRRRSYTLYVPSSVLLRWSHQGGTPCIVSWDEWGLHTRFMQVAGSYRFMRYVHGQRVVLPTTDDGTIQVLDFNVQNSLPYGFTFKPGLQQSLCTTPAIIMGGDFFATDIESRLPYLLTTVEVPVQERCHAYLIDHERIIGLTVNGPSAQRITAITTHVL